MCMHTCIHTNLNYKYITCVQVDKVRDIQDCLQRELVALDVSKTLPEISQHQRQAEDLKCQLDEMLLLLKVHIYMCLIALLHSVVKYCEVVFFNCC